MLGLAAVYGLGCVIDVQGGRASDWLTCDDSPPSLPDSIAQTGAKHHMAMEISVSRDCITFHSLDFPIDLSSTAENVKANLKMKILSEASQAWRPSGQCRQWQNCFSREEGNRLGTSDIIKLLPDSNPACYIKSRSCPPWIQATNDSSGSFSFRHLGDKPFRTDLPPRFTRARCLPDSIRQ